MNLCKAVVVFSLCCMMSNAARAVPVEWTLHDVFFGDPSSNYTTVTGSFVYDVDTNTFSVIDLLTEGSVVQFNHSWNDGSFVSGSSTQLRLVEGGAFMQLDFPAGLSNAGGDIRLNYGEITDRLFLTVSVDPTIKNDGGLLGIVLATPVPEPEIYAMLGVGLGFMGWMGRRKRLRTAA